jgi:mono/diheme cytochrome c family protein
MAPRTCIVAAVFSLLLGGCDLPGRPRPEDQFKRPATVLDFATLYKKNCAGCHGADGKLGPAPPLHDRRFLAIVPDKELLRVVLDGRPGTSMPAFWKERGGELTREQAEVLVRGIRERWGGKEKPKDDTPPYLPSQDVRGDAARGMQVFKMACAGCHGDRGQGGTYAGRGNKAVGAINDLAFLALASDQALRRYVITGRYDLNPPMPGWDDPAGRTSDFRPLTNQDVADLVALLASWRAGR